MNAERRTGTDRNGNSRFNDAGIATGFFNNDLGSIIIQNRNIYFVNEFAVIILAHRIIIVCTTNTDIPVIACRRVAFQCDFAGFILGRTALKEFPVLRCCRRNG